MDSNTKFLSSQTAQDVDYLKDRISYGKKKANNFNWARQKIDYFDSFNTTQSTKYAKVQANEDLYNGIWDPEAYSYIENPYDIPDFTTPTKLEHVDIISLPLREMIGSELKRPFKPMAIAINPEAASKRRRERLKLLKEYVYQQIMGPLQQELAMKYQEQAQSQAQPQDPEQQGQQQSPEQMQQQMQQELETMTPEEISRYMKESYKLPEEEAAQKLINILIKDLKLHMKFNQGWHNAVNHAEEVYYVGIRNGEPVFDVVNIAFFNYDKSNDVDFIHDGEWATYEQVLLISDIYDRYGEYLTEKDRKKLDNYFDTNYRTDSGLVKHTSVLIDGSEDTVRTLDRKVRVLHCVFKSLKKIKFITTLNEFGEEEEFVTDETYVFNPEVDLNEEIAWIPEVWEGTKIGTDIYVNMRPIPNQYRDLNKPYKVKLPYVGLTYRTRNSEPVSLLDRGKHWQFVYNILWFRLQEVIATDKGNVLLAVLKQIPKGWKPHEWLQYLSVSKVGFLDTTQDISPVGTDPQYWKSVNLSNNADIQKYISLLEYCEQRCLRTIGSNENRVGTVTPYETVTNNQQKLIQSSNITEPEFYMHNIVKEEALTALLEQAKIAYRNEKKYLAYVLDDFSIEELSIDPEQLNASEFGVYVSNSTDDMNALSELKMQLDRIIQASNGDLRIVGEIITAKNPASIKRVIDEVSEELKAQQAQAQQAQQQQAQAMQEIEKAKMEHDSRERQLDRENRLKEAAIRAMGYSSDGDVDLNQVPDVLEANKFNAEISFKSQEQNLKQKELDIRARELTENNASEDKDRQIELEKLRAKERIENNKIRAKQNEKKK